MRISSGHTPFPDYPRDPFVTHISFMVWLNYIRLHRDNNVDFEESQYSVDKDNNFRIKKFLNGRERNVL
ncbi:unnamed protein product [Rhizophagus irregularis]|nr:unnamed protein product [Rhizophagus irregularis]